MIFLSLNVDLSSPRPDPIRSMRPAHEIVKEGYPPRSGYFSDIGLSSMKTLADRHRHAA